MLYYIISLHYLKQSDSLLLSAGGNVSTQQTTCHTTYLITQNQIQDWVNILYISVNGNQVFYANHRNANNKAVPGTI